MGRPKQMLAWQGKTLLRHVLESLINSNADEIILVLGHEAEAVRKSVIELQIETFENRIPEARIGDLGTDFKSVPLPPRSVAPAKTTV